MAITSSAKKALRVSVRKGVFNLRRKKNIQDPVRQIKKLVSTGKIDEAVKLVPDAYQAFDKAVKSKTIKKNNASRKKSRLMALINKAKTSTTKVSTKK
jgi:small subunit ribosomal protein S20